jgi:predicted transcriptional regulator
MTARTRLTVDLPRTLVEQADALVARSTARSRNRLIAQALEMYLKQLEEAEIDAQFARMEHDERYRDLSLQLAKEFERSDWASQSPLVYNRLSTLHCFAIQQTDQNGGSDILCSTILHCSGVRVSAASAGTNA